MNSPSQHFKSVNGVKICYFVWNESAENAVLLIHATGFHARCWDSTVAYLGPQFKVIALELRGHGRSENKPPYDWLTFGEDLKRFVKDLDLSNAVGVGHSMGGHCLTQACAVHPECFRALLLVDPVIADPRNYPAIDSVSQWDSVDSHPISRRRNEWKSADEMFENFRNRHPFSIWKEKCLMDYCKWGLLKNSEGSYNLACPPRVEASIYVGSRTSDVSALCRKIRQPVVVMRAQPINRASQKLDFSKSPTWPDLHRQFAQGEDRYHPELSHFIPMERSDLVAQEVSRLSQL
ncbi:MAG: alpha/beta hydrolase [Gammaproteobacteria bacterium]|nr:alpha/beta hydrolase [Gammaproteobacteria bacterium]